MTKLTDYKPLESVLLPGLDELECAGLILVVGPNSSGKTQLLRDLYARLSGQPRELVVAKQIKLRKPEFDAFIQSLLKAGFLETLVHKSGDTALRPRTTILGTQGSSADLTEIQAKRSHSKISDEILTDARQSIDFFNIFLFAVVTGLFLDTRLQLANEVGSFDYENKPPSNELHSLSLHDEAMNKLSQEMKRVFSQAVWLDGTRGQILCIRVSDSPDIPNAEERHSRTEMAKYRTIDAEGDGIKSYAATCISLLLGLRPVCLIDEPELCLHPPQAHSLGKFIGKFGSSKKTVTFVATHSSHVLRGVIETGSRLQIVRLTRNGGNFQAHHVPSELLADILIKPTARAETVLDGIFSQAVAVVEAEGDRTVYQAAWETVNPENPIDIHYVAVGGTGGFADTCRLYRALQIPVAAIADLDIIADADKFKKVLSELTDAAITETLVQRATDITDVIKKTPPLVDADAVRTELQTAIERPLDWSQDHDSHLKTILARLVSDLDRKGPLKKGVKSVSEEIREDLSSLIDDCKQYGLFLVPVGELEEWLSEYVSASKQNKWAWANAAAFRIREVGRQGGDIWDFIADVGNHLMLALGTENLAATRLSDAGDIDAGNLEL